MNRKVAGAWGLSSAVWFNALAMFLLSTLFYLWVRLKPEMFPEAFRSRPAPFSMLYLLPAFFGITVVAGVPYAISMLGAFRVFVLVVMAQMIASLLWDLWVEGIPLEMNRVVAALLAVAAAFVSGRKF